MSLIARTIIAGVVVLLAVLAAWVGESGLPVASPVQRWFSPGELGQEPGRAPGPPPDAAFFTRAFSGLATEEERAWGARNSLTPALAFSHNLTTVFPPSLHDRHPEFFPLEAGKRLRPPPGSYYWNPDIAREEVAAYAAEAARRHFDAHPQAVSFALGVNDALIWGESPELAALATPPKWFRERPDYSPVVFTFMNRAAAALSRAHPDKYLGALAYYWAENAPPFPLHPRVVPFLTADRSQGYDETFRAEEQALQKKWGALAGRVAPTADPDPSAATSRRLGIYDYVYGGGFLIPRIHTRLLSEHLQHARSVGFTDYYAEVNPNWGLDGPMPWLTAQLIRDPRQARERLLNEYYARYFAEAAAPMRRFFERCEELWMAQPGPSYWLKHYRNESQAVVFPAAACLELRAMLEAAGQAARHARTAARVRRVSEAFGVTERFLAFHRSREQLLRVTLTRQPAPTIANALAEFEARRGEFIRYTNALVKADPLALHRFLWNDYLKNDPVATARWALGSDREREAGAREQELLLDAAMTGPLQRARTIAELTYGVALPAGWISRVEPAEFHRAELIGSDGPRRLRVEGSKDTTVSQWVALTGRGAHRGSIQVRGHVSPSTVVTLVLAFLDASQRHIGLKAVRLPDGDWPEWVTLRQLVEPPAQAAWVGLGLRVQNQVRGDWAEAREFSLRATPAK